MDTIDMPSTLPLIILAIIGALLLFFAWLLRKKDKLPTLDMQVEFAEEAVMEPALAPASATVPSPAEEALPAPAEDLDISLTAIPSEQVDLLMGSSKLFEIKDNSLKQGILSSGTVLSTIFAEQIIHAKETQHLYRLVNVDEVKLYNVKNETKWYRGLGKDKDGNTAHAVLEKTKPEKALAMANIMQSMSLVVGMYYMAEINQKMAELSRGVEQVYHFLENEYLSRIQGLLGNAQELSRFQKENLEQPALASRCQHKIDDFKAEGRQLMLLTLQHLRTLLTKDCAKHEVYLKKLEQLQKYYQLSQLLLQVIEGLCQLDFVFSRGAKSQDYAFELQKEMQSKQEEIQELLVAYHKEHMEKFEIHLETASRNHQGFAAILNAPINFVLRKANECAIPQKEVHYIEEQMGTLEVAQWKASRLSEEQGEFYVQGEKLYFMPSLAEQALPQEG